MKSHSIFQLISIHSKKAQNTMSLSWVKVEMRSRPVQLLLLLSTKKGSGNSKAHDVIRNTITELSTYHQ